MITALTTPDNAPTDAADYLDDEAYARQWEEYQRMRYKLQVTANLLLFYSHTSNFFKTNTEPTSTMMKTESQNP